MLAIGVPLVVGTGMMVVDDGWTGKKGEERDKERESV